jgi:hypothetical protein
MKLTVPQKIVGDIPLTIIDNILKEVSEYDWHVADWRRSVPTMGDTYSIPIMHSSKCLGGKENYDAINDIHPQTQYEKFSPLITPVLEELKKYYKFEKYAAFIASLKPYGVIGMHQDAGYFLTKCHRVHVPLLTNEKVSYVIEGNEYLWEKGKIYEFDNTRIHGVINRSDQPRIHLVINLYPQELLQDD